MEMEVKPAESLLIARFQLLMATVVVVKMVVTVMTVLMVMITMIYVHIYIMFRMQR
jgi:hypothetical protein